MTIPEINTQLKLQSVEITKVAIAIGDISKADEKLDHGDNLLRASLLNHAIQSLKESIEYINKATR